MFRRCISLFIFFSLPFISFTQGNGGGGGGGTGGGGGNGGQQKKERTISQDTNEEIEVVEEIVAEEIPETKTDTIVATPVVAKPVEEEYDVEFYIDSFTNVLNDESKPIIERANAGRFIGRLTKNSSPAYAIEILKRVEELVGENRDEEDLDTYMLMSGAFRIQGNYPMALDAAQKALELAQELDDESGISDAYNSLGQLYERQEDFPKALEYHEKALALNLEMEKEQRIGKSYSNIGNIKGQMFLLTEALKSYEKSLEYLIKAEDKKGIAIAYGNMGYVYSLQADSVLENGGSMMEARTYYLVSINKSKLALEYFEMIGNENFILNAKNNIALVYNSMGDFSIARDMCAEVLDRSILLGFYPIERDACSCLHEAYKGLGDTKKALKYHERFTFLKDSLLNMDEQRMMLEQELSFNYEKQAELADELYQQELSTQKQLAEEDAKKRNIIIVAVVAVALILVFFAVFLYGRFKVIRKQNSLIHKQKEDLQFQKELVDVKNAEITDSIVYAKRFQTALLPDLKTFKTHFKDSFIYYKPKDIVAGDFYWSHPLDGGILFAVADCTGHGVPGAMVSLICNNALNRCVREYGLTDPGEILDRTKEIVIEEFAQEGDVVKDGMDIALCHLSSTALKYAGAHNPLWVIRKDKDEIEEVKANKQPVGNFHKHVSFTTHLVELQEGDQVYLFSDGYADQFGGERGKKFKAKNFKKLLIENAQKSMDEQYKIIDQTHTSWKGNLEQLDDVCVIGVKI